MCVVIWCLGSYNYRKLLPSKTVDNNPPHASSHFTEIFNIFKKITHSDVTSTLPAKYYEALFILLLPATCKILRGIFYSAILNCRISQLLIYARKLPSTSHTKRPLGVYKDQGLSTCGTKAEVKFPFEFSQSYPAFWFYRSFFLFTNWCTRELHYLK
jgi:hypothetical protein